MNQRNATPLILHNSVPPAFHTKQSARTSSNRQLNDYTREIEQEFKQLSSPSAFRNKMSGDVTDLDFGQLPKRTVSLGPRRPAPMSFSATQPEQQENILKEELSSFRPLVSKSPFLRNQGGDNTPRGSSRSFNKMADELQSSLTELNNLIDSSTPKTPSKSLDKPPKFMSYVTSENVKPRLAVQADDEEEDDKPRLTTWEIDSMNWKASSSVTDLRSRFDCEPKLNLPKCPTPDGRPPRSASPSLLKNSPWLQPSDNSGTLPAPQVKQRYQDSDYAIRRTTSTQSRSTSTTLRNPYRSYYGDH